MSKVSSAVYIAESSSGRARAVVTAVAGNLIEWYDFSVYSFVAVVIGKHYFPSDRPDVSLLTTFAVFGIGFLARPLGAILIGRFGDKLGRRFALMLSMGLMTFGTALIGLSPDFSQIGIAAPILVLLARLCQGFAVGGEWGNSAAFLVEWAPEGRRGFYGSFQAFSNTVGALCGSAVCAILYSSLGQETMQTWGWRIPFLIAGVLGLIVTVMRRTMEDPPVYRNANGEAAGAEINMSNGMRTLRAIGLILPFTVGTYVFLNYLPTFINTQAKLPASEALWANTMAAIIAASSVPFWGGLSDRIGRKPQLLMAGALFVVLPYPIFTLLLSGPGFWTVLGSQTALDLTHAMVGSLAAATLSELFPTRIRTTWMTTVYALTVTIFGGFAPFIVTYLILVTGKPIAPVFYIMSAGIISLLIVSGYRETAFRRLE